MVFIGTVIRTASCSWRLYSLQITFHFWKCILLNLSFFQQKWGGEGGGGGPRPFPLRGACFSVDNNTVDTTDTTMLSCHM